MTTHLSLLNERRYGNICFAILVFMSIALVSGMLIFSLHRRPAIFQIPNFIGPTTQSLLSGRGLEVCTEEMGTQGNPICFHGARMPVGTQTIAAGVRLFGNEVVRVALFKCFLALLPLWAAMAIVLRQVPVTKTYLLTCTCLLLIPYVDGPLLARWAVL